MASRATRNALMAIGLAHGTVDSVEKSYGTPPPTVAKMINRVRTRCKHCFNLWPDQLTQNEVRRIHARMKVVDQHLCHNRKTSVVAILGVVLAMLSDLADTLSGEKLEAVKSLIVSCRQLYRNYDRRLDKWDIYYAIRDAVNEIYAMEA